MKLVRAVVRLFRTMQDKVRKKLAPAALRERSELVDVDVARAAGTRRAVCLFVFVCVCVCLFVFVLVWLLGCLFVCLFVWLPVAGWSLVVGGWLFVVGC